VKYHKHNAKQANIVSINNYHKTPAQACYTKASKTYYTTIASKKVSVHAGYSIASKARVIHPSRASKRGRGWVELTKNMDTPQSRPLVDKKLVL
jgi:hypothetical protein